MATYIGSAGGVDTATMPSHQAGDLIIAMGFRDGSTTAPALPSGQNWTNLINGGANACSQRVAYKIATSPSEAVGTFTNANAVVVAVYRPGSGETLSVGASAQAGANSSTLTWPGLTLTDADGSSWVIGFAGARDPAATIETPFTGMSNRLDYINPTICEAVIHDTTAGVTSWSTGTQSTSGGSSHRAVVVEMVVTASGGDGNATGLTNTVTSSLTTGTASADRNPTATGFTQTVSLSLTAGSASAGINGDASGASYTLTSGLSDGAASGVRNPTATGLTAAVTSSMTAGTGTGVRNPTATGATITVTSSLTAGTASGVRSPTVNGLSLTITASLTAGNASAGGNGNASGASLAVEVSLTSGAASGGASVAGASYALTSSLTAGTASAALNGSASGQAYTVTVTFAAGSVSASNEYVAVENRLFAPRIKRALRSPEVSRRLDAPGISRRLFSAEIARSLQAPAIKRKLYS